MDRSGAGNENFMYRRSDTRCNTPATTAQHSTCSGEERGGRGARTVQSCEEEEEVVQCGRMWKRWRCSVGVWWNKGIEAEWIRRLTRPH
ncbi:hypothetical protein E2C01_077786 [Portunus trituberculatus]|uniref:Uncharacterized protein n=1 Tax=Portunus trituberculatus TaxID=210409 RepID=A0A5B7IL68_PORTR|nr:hypothetical protein [Portunus trituberculatus]